MDKNFLDIRFEGSRFSPKKLRDLTGLPIKSLAEFGEIGERGRYKGKQMPYGLGILHADPKENESLNTLIERYSDSLLKFHPKIFSEFNVEKIVFDVETSMNNESILSIKKEIATKLYFLNAEIDFHPIEDEENFESFLSTFKEELENLPVSKLLPKANADRIDWLISKKVLGETSMNISFAGKLSAKGTSKSIALAILYLMKYKDEMDKKKIPSFVEVVKKIA